MVVEERARDAEQPSLLVACRDAAPVQPVPRCEREEEEERG